MSTFVNAVLAIFATVGILVTLAFVGYFIQGTNAEMRKREEGSEAPYGIDPETGEWRSHA